jgi:predicted nucleotidyltransferase
MKQIFEQLAIPWLEDRTVLLVRHGSHAYGTNTPTSDEDFKGIAIAPRSHYLGFVYSFEQAEIKPPREPDTVIYDIRKFFDLAAACNPNIIEVLHTDSADHIIVSKVGEEILEHKDKFISKRARYTFAGYAKSQLHRIKNHRRWLLDPPKGAPTRADFGLPEKTLIPQDQYLAAKAEIQKELDRFNLDFLEGFREDQRIAIHNAMEDILAELRITTEDQWLSAARKIGLSDNFILLMQREREYEGKKREWVQYKKWCEERNEERAALEAKFGYDTKHAYHLVRLIRMCEEILSTGKVIVKRPDAPELLDIRRGAWIFDRLIDYSESKDRSFDKLCRETKAIPDEPDMEFLDNLCMKAIERLI